MVENLRKNFTSERSDTFIKSDTRETAYVHEPIHWDKFVSPYQKSAKMNLFQKIYNSSGFGMFDYPSYQVFIEF